MEERIQLVLDRFREAGRLLEMGRLRHVPEDEIECRRGFGPGGILGFGRSGGVFLSRRGFRKLVGGREREIVRFRSVGSGRPGRVRVNRKKDRGFLVIGDRGALIQGDDRVARARQERFDPRFATEHAGKPRRNVECDVLFQKIPRPDGSRLLAAMSRVDHDGSHSCGRDRRGHDRRGRDGVGRSGRLRLDDFNDDAVRGFQRIRIDRQSSLAERRVGDSGRESNLREIRIVERFLRERGRDLSLERDRESFVGHGGFKRDG